MKASLPKPVAEKYELVNWKGGAKQYFGSFGTVDLEKLTVQRADRLVAMGFTKLRLIEKPKSVETRWKKKEDADALESTE